MGVSMRSMTTHDIQRGDSAMSTFTIGIDRQLPIAEELAVLLMIAPHIRESAVFPTMAKPLTLRLWSAFERNESPSNCS